MSDCRPAWRVPGHADTSGVRHAARQVKPSLPCLRYGHLLPPPRGRQRVRGQRGGGDAGYSRERSFQPVAGRGRPPQSRRAPAGSRTGARLARKRIACEYRRAWFLSDIPGASGQADVDPCIHRHLLVLSDAGIGGDCAGSGALAKCQACRIHSGQTDIRSGLQERPAFSCSRIVSLKGGHSSRMSTTLEVSSIETREMTVSSVPRCRSRFPYCQLTSALNQCCSASTPFSIQRQVALEAPSTTFDLGAPHSEIKDSSELGLFRGLVKSQFSPISPNPQTAFRLSSSVFSISCGWSASCTWSC